MSVSSMRITKKTNPLHEWLQAGTDCPHGVKNRGDTTTRTGSIRCSECEYYVGHSKNAQDDIWNFQVLCSHPKAEDTKFQRSFDEIKDALI